MSPYLRWLLFLVGFCAIVIVHVAFAPTGFSESFQQQQMQYRRPEQDQLQQQKHKQKQPQQRSCFSKPGDYLSPLKGEWQSLGGTSGRYYSDFMGDRESLRRGDVSVKAAKRWANQACMLEDAVHSCFYLGERHRAEGLAARHFVASDCLLRQFDGHEFMRSLPETDIWLVGDSIIRQLWQSLGCHLAQFITKADVYWVSSPWQGRSTCPFIDATHCYSYGPDCVLLQHNGSSTKLCYIMNHPDMGLDTWLEGARRLKLTPTSHELVLFNGGLHFQSGNHDFYRRYLEKIAEGGSTIRASGGRFIWLETTPQHFPTEDGSYNASIRGGCTPLANEKDFVGNMEVPWCNEIAAEVMKREGFEMLYTFEHARGQWDSHVEASYRTDHLYESGDCSHFCLPGIPDLWTQTLFGMLTTAKEPD